ncbi:hypothetical protein RND81_04G140100 [Saponaria officinalis]|uniref:VWFA domain-containing protein n=1 Tax=Saponaria officinalis TaxID=3572 RepID=A0AAW1LLJ5_SAPOF
MADEFNKSVQLGLKLSQRIYYGKDLDYPATKPPAIQKWPPSTAASKKYLPTAPMMYAVVSNPKIVDNPDIRSYQPYVHGKCSPPALIPLHMKEMKVEIECCVDVAFVTVVGSWRVHCVDSAKCCDCRLVIPMGEQVSSSEIHGAMLVQTPPNDLDQREIFAFYLFPGYTQNSRVFRKRAIFLVDISGSMIGAPLENVKQAVLGSLSKFNQDDSFNIIAFNREAHMFAKSMELATEKVLERAREWFSAKLIAEGDTDIMLPMKQALEMVSHKSNSISFIFLVTDGAVANEREICNVVKNYCSSKEGLPSPRISTFGIGSYCNHYFLRMLAQIGRGHYDAACDANSVALRLQRFLTMSSSVILSNIEVNCLNHLDSPMLYSAAVQDLSYECPVILSGRMKGKLPESIKIHGTLADMSSFTTNLKIQEAKDIPIEKVHAQTHIDFLTAIAWFTGSKEVEKQVADISVQTGFPSEYTRMILTKTQDDEQGLDFVTILGKEAHDKSSLQKMVMCRKLFPLQSLGVGFGDLKKTAENLPPGVTVKTPDATDMIVKAATGCCHQFLDRCCCMCCIQVVSKMSDRFVITLTQICAALSCCQCLDCCYDLCANCS